MRGAAPFGVAGLGSKGSVATAVEQHAHVVAEPFGRCHVQVAISVEVAKRNATLPAPRGASGMVGKVLVVCLCVRYAPPGTSTRRPRPAAQVATPRPCTIIETSSRFRNTPISSFSLRDVCSRVADSSSICPIPAGDRERNPEAVTHELRPAYLNICVSSAAVFF